MDIRDCLELEPERIWRRAHRPEEYAEDAAKFVAREIKIPFIIVKPFVPIARSILSKWEDAAVETTVLFNLPGGKRMLRTYFQIADYSNEAVYGMIEKILRRLGVGASFSRKCGDTDFAWVLLEGVLDGYAKSAGISEKTAQKLIDFRFCLSDYFTATTWFPHLVEIANLKTGRVEATEIPPDEISRIVDWAIKFERKKKSVQPIPLEPGAALYEEYARLDAIYREIKSSG